VLGRVQGRVAGLERDVVLLQEASAVAKTHYAEGVDASDVDQLRRQIDADLRAQQAAVVRAVRKLGRASSDRRSHELWLFALERLARPATRAGHAPRPV